MNREWMREQLEGFAQVADVASRSIDQSDSAWSELRRRSGNARMIFETLRVTLGEREPTGGYFDLNPLIGAADARNAAQKALGVLDDMDTWADHLKPDTPTLAADQLHPWVWEGAQSMWGSKQYRAAVDAAARMVNENTRTKVDRLDLSDTNLMNQVLNPGKPTSGKKYLRIPGDQTDQTVANRNRALRPFGEGWWAGVRALAAHEAGPDWDQQQALESLAALSILARWIDECEVVTAL
jgi:hypothetical protein